MEDGIVLTFNVDKYNFTLSGKKSIVLGTEEAKFQVLPRHDGLFKYICNLRAPKSDIRL